MKNLLLFHLLLFIFITGTAQDAPPPPTIHIKKTTEKIRLDGVLDEAVWQEAAIATNFMLNQPVDDKAAEQKTEVRLTYDDRFLYVAAQLWDDPNYIIQTLKRDDYGGSDGFAVMLDPIGQKTNGFGFGVNAMGAQTEVLVYQTAGLAAVDVDGSWDNKWLVEVERSAEYWIVEMAIPFKTLRYKSNITEWGINFGREEPGSNESHVWSPVPRQFDFTDPNFYGKLIWDEAPKKQGNNISMIPYATARLNQDHVSEDGATNVDYDFGGDAKVAISPTLNLDLTVNPDFSQVEVDRQVTNLTRFNIFFPERRQFFQENADIFNNFGQFAERPFYSRRIGLDAFGQTVPILYGARLSGNLNKTLRIGAFNMHTRGDEEQYGQNYSALSFQQRVLKRSSVKGIFLNRQSFDGTESVENDFGRTLGGEFNYSTENGKWTVQTGYLQSLKEGISSKNAHRYGLFAYNGTNFRAFLGVQNMQEDYSADLGFTGRLFNFDPDNGTLERAGFTQFSNFLDYYHYPKDSKRVNVHWSGLENFVFLNADASLNEWYTRVRHFIFFKNTSQLRFRFNRIYVDLLYPFALTTPALPKQDYLMHEFNIQLNTDRRKKLGFQTFVVYGQFYGGTKLTSQSTLTYRVQPWGNFALGFEQNAIRFPEPYTDLNLILATARMEINFSTNLFWTTFLQYNTQSDNFNINSRLQWRFAPMSDVFLVYTDNYDIAGMFGPKTRSVVLKVNYWLTL